MRFATKRMTHLKRELGLRDLTLFAIACIVGPRWIAVAASAGPGSVILWIGAAVLFAAPLGVAVAALIHKYPDAGGLYAWTRHDFGPWHGFLCFWLYWFSIALTLPNSAMFAMSMSAYALGPKYAFLADNQMYVVLSTFVSIWIALGTNIIGLKIGKWTENLGGITAWMLGFLLVGAGAAVWMRRGSATPMNTTMHFAPAWSWDTLGFFGAMAFGLSGMEAIGLMAAEIRQPRRTVVPATWIGTLFTTGFYVAGTLALLVLIAPASVSELHGIADGSNVAAGLLGLPLADAADRPDRAGEFDWRMGRPGLGRIADAVCGGRRSSPSTGFRAPASEVGDALPLDPGVRRRSFAAAVRGPIGRFPARGVSGAALAHGIVRIHPVSLLIRQRMEGRLPRGGRFGNRHDPADHRFERGAHRRGPKLLAVRRKARGGNRTDDRHGVAGVSSKKAL